METENKQETNSGKNKKLMVIVAAAVALLIVGGIGIALVLNSNTKSGIQSSAGNLLVDASQPQQAVDQLNQFVYDAVKAGTNDPSGLDTLELFDNELQPEGAESIAFTITISTEDTTTDAVINVAGMGKQNPQGQYDWQADISADITEASGTSQLAGQMKYIDNKVFFRVDDLPSELAAELGDMDFVNVFLGTWLKLDVTQATELTGVTVDATEAEETLQKLQQKPIFSNGRITESRTVEGMTLSCMLVDIAIDESMEVEQGSIVIDNLEICTQGENMLPVFVSSQIADGTTSGEVSIFIKEKAPAEVTIEVPTGSLDLTELLGGFMMPTEEMLDLGGEYPYYTEEY